MRLTLRTLLAYLDNTLDPQDAEVLRQKVEQSGQATQLVQRIRDVVKNDMLSAPAPDSVHPIEEPNMMSNYLDSTLSPEQVAEIEKACLTSDPHLAEAAACHQILTMVLGRPAEASDGLRDRIHSMVDELGNIVVNESGSSAAGGLQTGSLTGKANPAIAGEIGPRYSSLDLPGEGSSGSSAPSSGAGKESSEVVAPPPVASDVRPVGVDDSGVFQAATKLREQSQQFAEAGAAMDDSEMLGAAPPLKELSRSDFEAEPTRRFSVLPWAVTAVLVATLIFAIFKIFAPLITPKVAQQSNVSVVDESNEALDDVSEQDVADGNGTDEELAGNGAGDEIAGAGATADETSEAETPDADPVPESPQDPEVATPDEVVVETSDEGPPLPVGMDESDLEVSSTGEVLAPEDSDGPPLPPGMTEDRIAALPDSEKVDSPTEVGEGGGIPGVTGAAADMIPEKMVEASEPEKAVGIDMPAADVESIATSPEEETGEAGDVVARLVSDNALVAKKVGKADWKLLPFQTAVQVGDVVVCAPEYRANFSMGDETKPVVGLVGGAEISILPPEGTVHLGVRFGRGTVQLASPGESIVLEVGGNRIVAGTESQQAILGFEVTTRRSLGDDPLVEENHKTELTLIAIQGDFQITADGGTIDLVNGSVAKQLAVEAFSGDAVITQPEQLPDWIDPNVDSGALEARAAADLLELLRADASDSLLVALRVAQGFRRNEVAALAGKATLALGNASGYFGVDGLFSKPKQRLYWSSHLDAVRTLVDRSVQDAAAVRTAIAGENAEMDLVEGDKMFRLLVGYSQDQLSSGGDAELVDALESNSVAVRVLASENLRDISGTTLFFKPEEEVASRRDEVVKKWKVRLRKESIRYPAAE